MYFVPLDRRMGERLVRVVLEAGVDPRHVFHVHVLFPVLSGGSGGSFSLEEGRCPQITGACDPLFSYLENISDKAQGI